MAMNSLGLVLRKFEDIESKQKAEDLYRRALSIAERLHGPDSAPMLIHKRNLAIALLNEPDYEEATNMLQSVLSLRERFSGEDWGFHSWNKKSTKKPRIYIVKY